MMDETGILTGWRCIRARDYLDDDQERKAFTTLFIEGQSLASGKVKNSYGGTQGRLHTCLVSHTVSDRGAASSFLRAVLLASPFTGDRVDGSRR